MQVQSSATKDECLSNSTALPILSPAAAATFRAAVDYEHFLDCVHCGLCTSACPTYLETGLEMDGPRGRIHTMRGLVDGKIELDEAVGRHLELCLDCRSCETACPSGVQYGRLIEPFRVAMEILPGRKARSADWFHRWILFPLFPYPNRMRLALWPVRWIQRLGIDALIRRFGLLRMLPSRLRQMHAMLPPLGRSLPSLPERTHPYGPKRATVALLTGCVADAVFRHVHWATVRVLAANGCEVVVPKGQTCCGALHYHAGAEGPAVERAVANANAIDPDDYDAIVVNVAGCGAMLKDYGHLPIPSEHAERVRKFAAKIRDVSEFLAQLGLLPPTGWLKMKATYHDACHLCHAQQIRAEPRKLLGSIKGLELAPLEESEVCCGAAGTYNLTEPAMAERLVERKASHILNAAPEAVFVANAGCALHIARKLREKGSNVWVAHPIEALDLAYQNERLAPS